MSENIVNKLTLPSGSGSGSYEIVKDWNSSSYITYQSDTSGCCHIDQLFLSVSDLNSQQFSKVYIASCITIGRADISDPVDIHISGYTTPTHVLNNTTYDVYSDVFTLSTTLFVQIYGYDQVNQQSTYDYLNLPICVRWFENRLIFDFPKIIKKSDGSDLNIIERYPSLYSIDTLVQLIK